MKVADFAVGRSDVVNDVFVDLHVVAGIDECREFDPEFVLGVATSW